LEIFLLWRLLFVNNLLLIWACSCMSE
jgi:hypothetical protein